MKRSNWADWVQPGATEAEMAKTRAEFQLGREAVPLFPVGGHFTPQSGCPHNGPIPDGSVFVCMTCHDTGMRRHPALKLDPATMPAPEPDPTQTLPEADPRPDAPLTRKQRRARKYHVGPSASTTGTLDSHAATAAP